MSSAVVFARGPWAPTGGSEACWAGGYCSSMLKKKKEDTAPAKVVGEIGGAMNKAGLGLNHFSNKDIRPSLSLLLRPPANRPHLHFCLGKKSLQTDR